MVREEVLEDVALARLAKSSGIGRASRPESDLPRAQVPSMFGDVGGGRNWAAPLRLGLASVLPCESLG